MAGLPRVRVVNPNESWQGTEYYIDGRKIEKVKGVDFHGAVDELPTFEFEMFGFPDIDMSGQVLFAFTPKTVEEAAKVLTHEIKTNPETRKAFVKSIESVLKEMPANEETWSSDLAESIANRIIGI